MKDKPTITMYAKLVYPNNGYKYDVENAKHLQVGDKYKVEGVSMGESNTSIYLENIKGVFNSSQFEFFDEFDKPVDIFEMPEFNHYLDIFPPSTNKPNIEVPNHTDRIDEILGIKSDDELKELSSVFTSQEMDVVRRKNDRQNKLKAQLRNYIESEKSQSFKNGYDQGRFDADAEMSMNHGK